MPETEPLRAEEDPYEASRRAFECDLPGTSRQFALLLEQAETAGRSDMASASLYGMIRHADESGEDALPLIERLRQIAEDDGDDAGIALALAWRAWAWITQGGGDHLADATLDLARATVLLEKTTGDEVVRASAHLRLAFSFLKHRLWELADEQYSAAALMVDAVDPLGKDPLLHRAALAYNRVVVQLEWGCALRELEDAEGAARRREEFRFAMEEADLVAMPDDWRAELQQTAVLMDAVAGLNRSADALARLADPLLAEDSRATMYLSVALEPDAVGISTAASACEQAIERLKDEGEASYYELAVYQACVLEALAAGQKTAGLRAVQDLVAQRARDRSAALLSIGSLVDSERLRGEHDLLSRHAYHDHLTGMANRRAFDRYLGTLPGRGIETTALLMIDVDHFKAVNDQFGHAVGDEVLRRLGAIFAGSVRTDDFAARIGGDEFVVVMVGSSSSAAALRAESIIASIAGVEWEDAARDLAVTVSIGVAAGTLEHMSETSAVADAALYRAKETGGIVATAT